LEVKPFRKSAQQPSIL